MNPNLPPAFNEAYQITGDRPAHRSMGGVNMVDSAACHPVVRWRDRLLTFDLFALPGQPKYLLLYCPICTDRDPINRHALRITEDNKQIDVDLQAIPKIPGFSTQELVAYLKLPNVDALRGKITVEQFGCTWEEDPSAKRDFFSVCPWNVKITDNIAVDVPRKR